MNQNCRNVHPSFSRILLVACITLLLALLTATGVSAVTYRDADTNTASSGCTMLGIEGTYYADAQGALDRINEIRKEACKEGVPDPRDKSKNLTEDDYVEIKWSQSLEMIARLRAAESSVTRAHKRLNGKSWGALSYGGITASSECLAWNYSNSLITGINQWYEEKSDWVNQTEGATTGHYTALINPSNTYVGLGDFNSSVTTYSNTLAGEFDNTCGSLGETPLSQEKDIIQKVEVKDSYISGYSLSGAEAVGKESTEEYIPYASVTYTNNPVEFRLLTALTYASSDTDIATVASTQDGVAVTGITDGTATITGSLNGTELVSQEITIGCKHQYDYKQSGSFFTRTCSLCGATNEISITVFWGDTFKGDFATGGETSMAVGDTLYVWPKFLMDDNTDSSPVTITSSDENVLAVSATGYETMKQLEGKGTGIVTFTLALKSDPNVALTYTMRVGDDGSADISSAKIATSDGKTTYEYTGTSITPTPVVTYQGITLKKGTDYTVSYENNTEVGTGKMIITGTGFFTGTIESTFKIQKKDIADATVTLNQSSYTYDTKAKTPSVTVKYNGTTLKKNTDYTLEYSNNTNAGTATVTVKGTGLYDGTVEKTFTIGKLDLSKCTLSLSATTMAYDGNPKTPGVTVKYGSTTLPTSDYGISYKDNTAVGTATVTATGSGNCSGTLGGSFVIKCDHTYGAPTWSWTGYDSAKATFSCTKGCGNEVVKDATITESTTAATCQKSGSTTYTATATYNSKNYTDTKVETLAQLDHDYATTVTKATVGHNGEILEACKYCGTVKSRTTISGIHEDSVTLTPADYAYDGNAKTPRVTVYDLTGTEIPEANYRLTYANNTKPGTGKVTITFTGNYDGTVTKTFSIVCHHSYGEPEWTWAKGYNSAEAAFTCETCGEESTEDATITENSTPATCQKDGSVTYTANVTFDGKDYTTTESKEILRIDEDSVELDAYSYTYNGTAKSPNVAVYDWDGETIAPENYTLSYANNTNAGTATVAITFTGDYYEGTLTEEFTIQKASQKLKVSTATKTVKYSKVKKKAQTTSKVSVSGAKASYTYKKSSGSSSNLSINSKTGKITVKKGTKKGTYKIKVKVTAKSSGNYNSATKTATVKVKVK